MFHSVMPLSDHLLHADADNDRNSRPQNMPINLFLIELIPRFQVVVTSGASKRPFSI